MRIELDLDEAEVLALRRGDTVPLSLRDKLGDAVHIREVGWYLVPCIEHDRNSPRPRWWTGTEWRYAPEGIRAMVHSDATEVERLYTDDER